jgi:hypothetical protein
VNFVTRVIVSALAIWLTSLLSMSVSLYSDGSTLGVALAALLIGLILTLVNTVFRPVVKLLSLPLYLLTFGSVLPCGQRLDVMGSGSHLRPTVSLRWFADFRRGGNLHMGGTFAFDYPNRLKPVRAQTEQPSGPRCLALSSFVTLRASRGILCVGW